MSRPLSVGISPGVKSHDKAAYDAAYYEVNRERIRANQKEWRKKNPTWHGLNNQNYKRMVIELLLARDGKRCGVCGKKMLRDEMSIDHIMQRAAGGTDKASNLRLAHRMRNHSFMRTSIWERSQQKR